LFNTLNQLYKKGDKEKVDAQVAEFFYTSVIPFNVIRNPAFAKMCEMIGRYGVGYKPPSYHDIREKLLKQAMQKTDVILEEFKEEWKRTSCTIMSDGWTDKKRRSICNFLVNSPKGTDRTLEEGLIQREKDSEEGHVSGRPKIWKVYSRRKKTGPGNIN